MLRLSTGRGVDGLWVGSSKNEAEPGLERVMQALGLIKSHDPVRYRRLLHDVKRVWIVLIFGGLAEFDHALQTCKLDERFVLDEATSIEQISATIVHEATHARLAHYGIEYDEPIRARVEAICMRREIAFSRKLPHGGGDVAEQAERTLALCAEPEYWTNAAFAERFHEGGEDALRHIGTPDAVIQIVGGASRWRLAARRFLRRLCG